MFNCAAIINEHVFDWSFVQRQKDPLPVKMRPKMKSNVVHSDPKIIGGASVAVGTRIPLGVLFENLATGASLDDILKNFTSLKREQALEAIREATTIIERSAIR